MFKRLHRRFGVLALRLLGIVGPVHFIAQKQSDNEQVLAGLRKDLEATQIYVRSQGATIANLQGQIIQLREDMGRAARAVETSRAAIAAAARISEGRPHRAFDN